MPPANSLQNKICLVTGATNGIGRETALGLARLGGTVVIIGRDAQRTAGTAAALKTESGNSNISFLVGDLSLMTDVRRLAAEFKAGHDRLDVLVNNAGGLFEKRGLTAEGIENTWALNHLSYFLLTRELLDLLKAAPAGRIVSVASTLHTSGKMDFDNLQGEKSYSGLSAYGRSKLANIMFTYTLARRLEGTGVTANCLHPGIVATNFGRNNKGWFKWLMVVMRPTMIKADSGAATSLYLASSPDVAGVSGKYFDSCKMVSSSLLSYDERVQEKLWSVSAQQVAG